MNYLFGSDNHSGVHPDILKAVENANKEYYHSYGYDDYTDKAAKIIKSLLGETAEFFPVLTGTAANVISLKTFLKPWEGVICAETAHINCDECGAPEHFIGCKLLTVATPDGKLTPELVEPLLEEEHDEHRVHPRIISISNVTELGTVYTPEEIKELCDFAHFRGLYVHLDGARFANACASLNCDAKSITSEAGVDVLSLGGTKNGMLIGESVVCFRNDFADSIKYIRKMAMQLYSKMRFISAQFVAYFSNDLWLKNARNANHIAQYLKSELDKIPEIKVTQHPAANAVFAIIPKDICSKIREKYFFYDWDVNTGEVRLMCPFNVTKEQIDQFIIDLKSIIK